MVFNGENVVLHGFPYTEEYTVGGEKNDMLVTKFENLSEYKVFTAYEYLEDRFDYKVRVLTSFFFLLQRGS